MQTHSNVNHTYNNILIATHLLYYLYASSHSYVNQIIWRQFIINIYIYYRSKIIK